MTSRDFCYWLQGYFEIMDPSGQGSPFPIGPTQAKCIKEHLQLVFKHEINPPAPGVTGPPIDWIKLQQQAAGTTGTWLDGQTFAVC
jgi:hypothetical protein